MFAVAFLNFALAHFTCDLGVQIRSNSIGLPLPVSSVAFTLSRSDTCPSSSRRQSQCRHIFVCGSTSQPHLPDMVRCVARIGAHRHTFPSSASERSARSLVPFHTEGFPRHLCSASHRYIHLWYALDGRQCWSSHMRYKSMDEFLCCLTSWIPGVASIRSKIRSGTALSAAPANSAATCSVSSDA